MSFNELFDYAQASRGKTPSALRISVGLVSNFADVYYSIGFLRLSQ